MSTNKQALTAESARESGNILFIVAARIARREHFNPLHVLCEIPQRVVSTRLVRDAVDRTEENLMCEVDKIVRGHDYMAKKLKEAEGKLQAAEKRIAELEARDKPKYVQCWSCKHDIEVLAIAECDGYCPRCAAPIDLDDDPYAGITVKGE